MNILWDNSSSDPMQDMLNMAEIARTQPYCNGLPATIFIPTWLAPHVEKKMKEYGVNNIHTLMRYLFKERIEEVGFEKVFKEYLQAIAQRGF